MSSIRTAVSIAVVLAALALSACGRSARPHTAATSAPTPSQIACTAPALTAMAEDLRVSTTAIGEAGSVGNNGEPQCRFRTRLARRNTLDVVVNVDNGPSPYFRLERTIAEDAQGFQGPGGSHPAQVTHLGLDAVWLPAYPLPQLETTDGHLLIIVTFTGGHASQRSERTLAVAMARPFLHTPHGKAASAAAKTYP